MTEGARAHGFRIGQIGSASMVSLAHGTNDAQKTMGVITLALIVERHAAQPAPGAPFWVIVSCALAISLGTYIGGWRVIRTLGKGLVEIESPQGMAAESSSAAVILLSSHFGYSLSTTHVATGSIIGTGLGKKGAEVRWNVAGRMATAWVVHAPVGRRRRRGRLRPGQRHRRHRRRGRRPDPADRRGRRHLLAVPQDQGRPRQRQRRVDRRRSPPSAAAEPVPAAAA